MKNAIKVKTALKNAFPGHRVEVIYRSEGNRSVLYIDDYYVGCFEQEFFDADYDNAEIELKVKVSLEDIKDYLSDPDRFAYRVFDGLERGFTEWENELHPNN